MKIKLLICLLLSLTLMLFASCDKTGEENNGDEINGGESSGNDASDGSEQENENTGNGAGQENSGANNGEDLSAIKGMVTEESPIKYSDENMADYLLFPTEKYKNFSLKLNISEPTRVFAKVKLSEFHYSIGSPTMVGEGEQKTEHTLGVSDSAYIYYRGYYLDENGNKVASQGMSNFGDSSPYRLVLGSGSFIPGFEYNLIGTEIASYQKFERITTGTVTHNQVIYVSYQRSIGSETDQASLVRIDLTEGNADSVYGEGFTAAVLGKQIGEVLPQFVATHNSKEITYEVKVEFATEIEHGEALPVKVVECYFPYNYQSTELQNKTAYFEVYVQYAIDYSVTELGDELIRASLNKIGVSEENLSSYEGESLAEKLESYIFKSLIDEYESNRESLLVNEIWKYYLAEAEVIKYPEGNLAEIYNSYLEDMKSQYTSYGGYIWTDYGAIGCSSFSEYAEIYLGAASGVSWQDALLEMSKGLIKERLIVYYILAAEDLMPDDDTLGDLIDDLKDEYLNEYINQYLEYYGKSKSDYSEEEFSALVNSLSADLFAYYNDDYFAENVCYNIFSEAIKAYTIVEQ